MGKNTLRIAILNAMLMAGGTMAGLEAAQAQSQAQTYRIEAGDLEGALSRFGTESGIQLIYPPDLLRGKHSSGLTGSYAPMEALRRLLEGSGLEAETVNDRTVVIKKTAAAPPPPPRSVAGGRDRSAPDSDQVTELDAVRVRKPFTDANVDIVRTENDVQPYYIFSGQEIAEANVVNVEEFLKQKLTMNTVSSTYSQSAHLGARGNASQVNLRGFGTSQTLILVNGRRAAGVTTSPASLQFDLNSFAPAMIERIEVLPSSASAIYGGNAVGGVVNIILKRDFTGGEFGLSYDTPLDKHAPVRSVTGGYGWSLQDGRTNITLSASYRDNETLLYKDRPELVQRGISHILARNPSPLIYGSSSPAYGATPNIASASGLDLVFKDGTPLGSTLTYVPKGTAPGTSAADLQQALLANAGQQNTDLADVTGGQLTHALRTPFSNTGASKSLAAAIRHQATERLELIGEAFYKVNRAHQIGSHAPSMRISASSPINPFQQDIIVRAPFAQTFDYDMEAESLRVVTGFVLDLPNDWRAQGDYTWNRTKGTYRQGAFDAASGAPTRGTGAEANAALADGTLNPLVDTVAYPLDLAPYTGPDDRYINSGISTLGDFGLRVSGPIGSLPAGRPNLTVGLGYREEKQGDGYSDFAGLGLLTDLPQSQRIASLYAEALVPLVAPSSAVPGVRLLDLQVAGRFEQYSVSANTPFTFTFPPDYAPDPDEVLVHSRTSYNASNYTVGLRYKPVDALTLRASYATAFLPPGFEDLLPGAFNQLLPADIIDPRRGNERYTSPYIEGGNPDLKPMDSVSWNFGILVEPESLGGLRLGLEWFRIERSNLIFSPSLSQVYNNEDLYPGRVTRAAPEPGDPFGVGRITFIDISSLNASKVSMKGLDFNIGYRHATERFGAFSVDMLGTVIDSFTRQLTLVSGQEEVAGQIFNGGPLKFRANATIGWEHDNWSLGWTALYYGPYDVASYDPQGLLLASSMPYVLAQGSTTVPHQLYHNALVGYRFPSSEDAPGMNRWLADVVITFGIRNVFNKVPPVDVRQNLVQYYSPFGDYRLRTAQLSLTKRF